MLADSSDTVSKQPFGGDDISELEQLRIEQFLTLLPPAAGAANPQPQQHADGPIQAATVLEIGAREGTITKLLAQRFQSVTALDLTMPQFQIDRVTPVQGDATALNFANDSFDCVVCTEVLEHIPDLERACKELSRVAGRYLIVGVPYDQDRRICRLTCSECGKPNPAWGHVNSFSEKRLRELFAQFEPQSILHIGRHKARTNWLSTWLLDLAGNPWGDYSQREPCIYCRKMMQGPAPRSTLKRICSKIAMLLFFAQQRITPETPIWLYASFRKKNGAVS